MYRRAHNLPGKNLRSIKWCGHSQRLSETASNIPVVIASSKGAKACITIRTSKITRAESALESVLATQYPQNTLKRSVSSWYPLKVNSIHICA